MALAPQASAGFFSAGLVIELLVQGVLALGETSVVTAARLAIVRAATAASTGAQWALNFALSAKPIGLVIGAIAALTAGVIWAYNNVGWFRDAVNAAWSMLQGWASCLSSHLRPILDWPADRLCDAAFAARAASNLVGGLGSLHIPGFAEGGVVPGAIGAPMLAILYGGETVIAAGGGGRQFVFHLIVDGRARSPQRRTT